MAGSEEERTLTDGAGRSLSFIGCGKIQLPAKMVKARFPQGELASHLDTIRNLQMRDDDVLICAFPKSGTHWLWEITTMLTNGKAEYDVRTKNVGMFEFNGKASLDSLPSPRVLNTHLPLHALPLEVLQRRIKVIFVVRNPKDVAVSHYNHFKSAESAYPGEFAHFLPLIIKENNHLHYPWFEFVQEFEQFVRDHPEFPIITLHYEAIKQDPIREISRLAKFLGANTDPSFIETVAEKCEFSNLKEANENIKMDTSRKFSQTGKSFIYRKGEVGDWKNWFTVNQSEEFDKIYNERMKDSTLTFKFSI
ncbi:hypothetical protein CHS0354_031839 [Potamilus streckersoni]|uniref:Sulfotransferase domain-containing protein n=1 Tax=Potamilus streckersoni TaxID=2493646 RepID=A0AAE0VKD6_9BIVA|nr:hypothetical protein CHS0354_031839 [Potamilus streckersoni]